MVIINLIIYDKDMNTQYFKLIIILFPLLFSCSEKELLPISKSLGKPEVVTNIVIEPIAGGAAISYKIPNSEDLLAIKCVYTATNGKGGCVVIKFYGVASVFVF